MEVRDRRVSREVVDMSGGNYYGMIANVKELDKPLKTGFRLNGIEGVAEKAQIVALIEIDPEDWGGCVLHLHVYTMNQTNFWCAVLKANKG
jgi:hypothetical protein